MQTLPVGRGSLAATNASRALRMIQEKCPICDGASARLVGEKDGLRVLRCAACTVQYSERAPEVSQLSEIYNKGLLPSGHRLDIQPMKRTSHCIVRAHRAYLKDLMVHTSEPGSLLDVGCATGILSRRSADCRVGVAWVAR